MGIRTERYRSLDGLRALSVGAVFLSGFHWFMPCGWIGVLVFYVLSGFLITAILVDERDRVKREATASEFFGRFYFRRTLRIFPLYFAYLFALELAHAIGGVPPGWEQVRPWAFLYAVNFGILTGEFRGGGYWGHLWTLSVEEQFYLLWPIVVWALSRAALLRLALATVALGPLIRYATMTLFGWSTGQLYVSSLSYLDAFAIGAVLATADTRRVKRVLPATAIACLATLLVGIAITRVTHTAFRTLGYPEGLKLAYGYIWGDTLLEICAALVILAALRGELPRLGHPVLAYLGKISYGIYLFQRPVQCVYTDLLEPSILAALRSDLLGVLVGTVVCLSIATAIAALSYRYFESPILRFRDRVRPPVGRLAPSPEALAGDG